MRKASYRPVVITGRTSQGMKESRHFTEIPWVRQQFIAKLGIDPYPGTLNLEVTDEAEARKLAAIKRRRGITITPAEAGFCPARCFPVVVCGRVKGALVIPQVPGYPESKMEIIAAVPIRDVLSLKSDEPVSVEVIPGPYRGDSHTPGKECPKLP